MLMKVKSASPSGRAVEERVSAVPRLLGLQVRIPPGAWMSVVECCVLSGRGLFDGLITRPEEPYRMWYICDCEVRTMRRPWATSGSKAGWKEGGNLGINSKSHIITSWRSCAKILYNTWDPRSKYQSTLRNVSKDQRFYLHHGGNLKSRIV
jgi:hypothetical protein